MVRTKQTRKRKGVTPARQRTTPRRKRANTADVLGTNSAAFEVPAKWQRHYRRLVEMRNYLRARRGDRVQDVRDERPTFSLHMGDAGTDEFDRNFFLSMISSEQNAIYEIEQALNRIRNGTYGICELTGKRIEPQRLAAIPSTRFSAESERQLEKDGAIGRTQFGERERVLKTSTTDQVAEEE